MQRKQIIILIFLLVIGFASVNTYLDINGKVDMSLLESDLDVVFKEVILNKEKSDKTIIIENGKSFIYSADDLNKENKTSTIDYVVMNKSHQYDVEVTVSCTSDYEDNLSYNGTLDNNKLPLEKGILIEAGEVKSGDIITELIKENTSEEILVLKCSLYYIPVSRETIVNEEEYIVTLESGYEEKLSDIKVKYYEEYSKLPELTRSNYKFLGWYTEEDIKVDNNSLVKIKGNHTLKAKWSYICPYEVGQTWAFNYTGSEQEFTVPCDGNYKLETWGAEGASATSTLIGGYGGYSSGNVQLSRGLNAYINVGGKGETYTYGVLKESTAIGGYNGGGYGHVNSSPSDWYYRYLYGGGGATHIATKSGLLSSLENTRESILIVSGGGGSGSSQHSAYIFSETIGGSGGGYIGGDMILVRRTWTCGVEDSSSFNMRGATQTSCTKGMYCGQTGNPLGSICGFGQAGANPSSLLSETASWGGGGGYYGGNSGAGGSGYIGNPLLTNKSMYCYNCTESNEESTKTISTTCTSSSPTSNCAKQGNGYAKITYLE